MPALANLQSKRANLVAQLEQHVGQINRINGAVALLDDLIKDEEAELTAMPFAIAPDSPRVQPEMPSHDEEEESVTHGLRPYRAPAEDAS